MREEGKNTGAMAATPSAKMLHLCVRLPGYLNAHFCEHIGDLAEYRFQMWMTDSQTC